MPNPNLELLELAADRLREFLPEIVFVGGCATGLQIDDPAAAPVRGTYDVDVIAEIVPMPSIPSFPSGFALWDSKKTSAKARRCAGGLTGH
jgi:hypothetical protein